MALQLGATLRNNMIGQVQFSVGASGVLKVFSGAEPANCAAADPSGLLATITLPATVLTNTGGVTTLAGTWSGIATGAGTAATFRIYDGSGTCHLQGNVGTSGADLNLNNTTIAIGQSVSVTGFALTAPNA